MKEFKKYGIWLGILFVLYVIVKLTTPQPTNWEKTLKDDDKNPFGTYILRQSLSELFPKTTIEDQQTPMYNVFPAPGGNSQLYIAIAPQINLSKTEVSKLLDFVQAGNFAFLSAESSLSLLADSIGLSTNTLYFNILDSSRVNLSDPTYKINRGYGFYAQTIDNYFDSFPKKYPVEKLGYIDQSQQVNFIKVSIGKGAILIHASPLCFSNAFILRQHNYAYVQQILSYIPSKVNKVYWDEYYSNGGEDKAQTPFRYFLRHFWLKTGFLLAWILLLWYALFAGKRRQRIIPVLLPPKNTTAQFIETVSALYYNQKSGADIFQKKIQHWQHYIRSQLHLSTEDISKEIFWEKLAAKSGVELHVLHAIRDEIEQLQQHYSDKIFMDLYQNIQLFYQKTSS